MTAATPRNPFERSLFLRVCVQERDEILRHKWIESEKAGRDIGYDRAMLDWVHHYRPRRGLAGDAAAHNA